MLLLGGNGPGGKCMRGRGRKRSNYLKKEKERHGQELECTCKGVEWEESRRY